MFKKLFLIPVILLSSVAALAADLDEILKFVKNADEIKEQVERIEPRLAKNLAKIIEEGEWQDSLFDDSSVYDILLRAYRDNNIDHIQFLDTQFYLQARSEFTGKLHCSRAVFLNSPREVKRINIIEPEYERYRKAVDYYLWEKATERYESEGKPVWVDLVYLSSDESKQLKTLPDTVGAIDDTTQHYMPGESSPRPYTASEQQATWLKTLYFKKMGGVFFTHINEETVILILTPGIQETRAALNNPQPVKLQPTFGSLTAEEVFTLRQNNRHPLALYHPDITNSLEKPHGCRAGAAGASLHDVYHHTLLNCLPEWQRTTFLIFDQAEMQLQNVLYETPYESEVDPTDKAVPNFKDIYCSRLQDLNDVAPFTGASWSEGGCCASGLLKRTTIHFVESVDPSERGTGCSWWHSWGQLRKGYFISPKRPLLDQDPGCYFNNSCATNDNIFSFLTLLANLAGRNADSKVLPEDLYCLKLYVCFQALKKENPENFQKIYQEVSALKGQEPTKARIQKMYHSLNQQVCGSQISAWGSGYSRSHRHRPYHHREMAGSDISGYAAACISELLKSYTGRELTDMFIKQRIDPWVKDTKTAAFLAASYEVDWLNTGHSRHLIRKITTLLDIVDADP